MTRVNKSIFGKLAWDLTNEHAPIWQVVGFDQKLGKYEFKSIQGQLRLFVRPNDLKNYDFVSPLILNIPEQKLEHGGKVAGKTDNNKVRDVKVRFHLGAGENFGKWKIENKSNKIIQFLTPEDHQLTMYNCKLTNSPATALKIFTGEINKSPIAWINCESIKYSAKVRPIIDAEKIAYNPRKAPNWIDENGNIIDNFVFDRLITFGRSVYYEHSPNQFYKIGGEISEINTGTKIEMEHSSTIEKILKEKLDARQSARLIAKDHLKEDPDYYDKLAKMESTFKHGGNIPPDLKNTIYTWRNESGYKNQIQIKLLPKNEWRIRFMKFNESDKITYDEVEFADESRMDEIVEFVKSKNPKINYY